MFFFSSTGPTMLLASSVLLVSFIVTCIKSQSANVTCIEEYCSDYSIECEIEYECRHCLSCVNDCINDIYPNDTSFEHWNTQNCTSLCIGTYGNQLFYDYNECLTDYNCVTLTPITADCLNNRLTLIDNFDISLLTIQSWMIYGRDYVYDCYPCQTFNFYKINETQYLYQPNYTMITLNDTYNPSYLSAPLTYDTKQGSSIMNFHYEDQGLSHNETWYIIGQNVSAGWTIAYYCGSANTWFYEGGIVMNVNKTLSISSLQTIENIINKNGLNFTEWCQIDNSLNGEGCGVSE